MTYFKSFRLEPKIFVKNCCGKSEIGSANSEAPTRKIPMDNITQGNECIFLALNQV